MANPVTINPTLTLAGQAAAFNADNNGLSLTITHVSFGRAHYDPTGDEVALVDPVGSKVPVAGASRPTPYQIRMVSAWREDVGQVAIGEIAFWAGDVLVFVWSQADGTLASYKTDGVTYVLFNDLAFAQVPANSISFVVDPDESVALAALAAHEGAYNAHPQYVLRAKFPDYQGHLWGTVGGTANAITLALPPIVELTEYITGNRFSFKAVSSNTGATTININGVGAVAVLKTGGLALTAGSIIAGGVYDVYYDGSKFQLTAGAGFASAEATEAEVLQTIETSDSTSWVSARRLLKALFKKAPLASPTFTGDPKAPTPAADDYDTSISTTEYVLRAMGLAGFGPKSTSYSLGLNVNLNDHKIGGSYGQASNGGATLPLNYPVALAGTLLVLTSGTSVVTQLYTVRGTALTYVRSFYGSEWSTWALMWDSSNTPKLASQTDTATAGAMLTQGAFGIGIAVSNPDVDINNYRIAGNYITPTAGLLNLPAGWAANRRYNVAVSGVSANDMYLVQSITSVMAVAGGLPLRAYRSMAGSGEFSAWKIDAPLDSPVLTGGPRAPTAPLGNSSDLLSNTLFVQKTLGAAGWGYEGIDGSALGNAVDLNTITTPGAYGQSSNTQAASGTNYPIPLSGTLLVQAANSGISSQVYIVYNASRMFVRSKTSGTTWTAWVELASEVHLPYRAQLTYKTAGVFSWTVPAGVYKVQVEVYGGGGSGGFGSQDTGSGGGGGGGISKRLCTVTPGSVITVTVGAGGAGTSVVGGSGSSGGGSSFGSFCSAAGGSGGSSGSGAVGGYGAGGDFNATRGSGSPAIRNAPGTYALGGAGGGGESIFATSNSSVPSQPGMGGGGRTSGTSQPGADGAVFITY